MVAKSEDSFLPELPEESIRRGTTADAVYEALCSALATGELTSGMTLHDATIAEHLHVSRTPIREALLRLRMLGVIDASPNRHTRIAHVPAATTAEALTTWTGLFGVLCEEVIPDRPDSVVAAMQGQHQRFLAFRASADDEGMATSNFALYAAAMPLSRNAVLVDAIRRVVFLIRLGGLQLPARIDVDVVEGAQATMLSAFRLRDPALAWAALASLRRLDIPRSVAADPAARE